MLFPFLANRLHWKAASVAVIASLASLPAFAVTMEELEAKYQQAMDLRSKGNLYGSIKALNHVLTVDPRLHRARLELAVAYYRAARYQQAVAQAQMVINDPSTPPEVKDTVSLFLEQIQSVEEADSARRHSVVGRVGFGSGHDDNVNVGPNDDIFNVNGSEFRLQPGDEEQSDAYVNFSAGVDHSYRLPGSFNMGEKPVQGYWQSSASVYRKEYLDEHPYTVDVVTLSSGPAFISRTNWRAKVDVTLDYIRLGDNALALYSSLNPSYTWVNGKNEYTVSGKWLYREFHTNENKDREGHRYGGSVEYGRRLTQGLSLQTGVGGYEQNARIDIEEFDVWDIYIGVYWKAWNQGALFTRASYQESDYKGKEPLFNTGRSEREQRYMVGMNHSFLDGFLKGWVFDMRVNYTDTHSRIAIYEYDRTELSMDLTRRY